MDANFRKVGKCFAISYYHILCDSPDLVSLYYRDSSWISRPTIDGLTNLGNLQDIHNHIISMSYHEYMTDIGTIDVQYSLGSMLVLVTGALVRRKDLFTWNFAQTFFLATEPSKKLYRLGNVNTQDYFLSHQRNFFILNDIIRYNGNSDFPTLVPRPRPPPPLVLGTIDEKAIQELPDRRKKRWIAELEQISRDVESLTSLASQITIAEEALVEQNLLMTIGEEALVEQNLPDCVPESAGIGSSIMLEGEVGPYPRTMEGEGMGPRTMDGVPESAGIGSSIMMEGGVGADPRSTEGERDGLGKMEGEGMGPRTMDEEEGVGLTTTEGEEDMGAAMVDGRVIA